MLHQQLSWPVLALHTSLEALHRVADLIQVCLGRCSGNIGTMVSMGGAAHSTGCSRACEGT